MTGATIHSSAIVSAGARLGASVEVGPGAIIEDEVEIGPGTTIGPYAIIRQFTRIGARNRIDAHAVIGGLPQHTGYDGSATCVVIGDDNVMREYVTINRAYEPGAATRIGSNCYFMTSAHIGHDCTVGDRVILTNGVMLGGHVEVGHNAIFGGMAGAHQFTRIGPFAMVGAVVPLKKDALPYSIIGGTPVRHYRLNAVGLRRNGITGERYRALEQAFRALKSGDRRLNGVPDTAETRYLRDWLAAKSRFGMYGFASGARGRRSGAEQQA